MLGALAWEYCSTQLKASGFLLKTWPSLERGKEGDSTGVSGPRLTDAAERNVRKTTKSPNHSAPYTLL